MARKALLVGASVVCLLGAGGLTAWHFWPQPPPTTAEEVVAAVMTSDPAAMPEKDLDAWIQAVASKAERLPPHEMQKLVEKALADPKVRERFESLSPEQRQKLVNLVSEEQRARMGAKFASGMVAALRVMPAPVRKMALEQMIQRRDAGMARAKAKGMEMSKDRVAQWLGATTPTQRAEMVRAMREMQQMMKDAGVKE